MSVGGDDVNIVESAGADEFGWLNIARSGVADRAILVSGDESLGESERPLESNVSGGIKLDDPLGGCGCLCSPSMWSGSGEGIRANGPSSGPCEAGESYELARFRVNEGFGRWKVSWS